MPALALLRKALLTRENITIGINGRKDTEQLTDFFDLLIRFVFLLNDCRNTFMICYTVLKGEFTFLFAVFSLSLLSFLFFLFRQHDAMSLIS